MQRGRGMMGEGFDGNYDSHGGSLFLGSLFYTDGGPISFDSHLDSGVPTSLYELPTFILSPDFTGRYKELQHIDRVFSTSDERPRRCVIYGMPGLGKTKLALKFATIAFEKRQYSYIVWVSAASVEKIFKDLAKFLSVLRLPGWQTLDEVSKVTTIRAWLEDSGAARDWLIVLDNVKEDTAKTLLDVLPRIGRRGRLLMTTRTAMIADLLTASDVSSQLALQTPGLNDALVMLSAGARWGKRPVNSTDAERLVQSMGNLPLAIDQAASFMRDTGSSPATMLNTSQSNELKEILTWENDLSLDEEKSVAAIFTPALDAIRRTAPDALTLLRILCFCDPEGIPIKIFEQGCNALHREDRGEAAHKEKVDSKLDTTISLFQARVRLSHAIQMVQRLSLATETLEGADRLIRIHDLVHLFLRSKLMIDQDRKQWLQVVINIVCKAFQAIDDHESPQNWSQCGQFISHLGSLEGFVEQYEIESIELLEASTLAAKYLESIGLYDRAEESKWRVLKRKERIQGAEHLSTMRSMRNSAGILREQGEHRKAENMYRRLLALCESVLGKEDPMTLMTTVSLHLPASQSK